MRIMDVLLAFPALLLAIAIVTVLGASLVNAQLAIGIVAIPIYARIMRASVLSVRENDFVTASRALGESPRGIVFRRILPNALTPLIVAGHARHRRRHPRRGGAVVPRPGRPAAPRRMGLDDRPGAQLAVHGAASHLLPGPRHHADRARLQPARRWPARCARPAAEPMTAEQRLRHRGDHPGRRSRRATEAARGERPLLEVQGLRTTFHTRDGLVRAVDGIDFQVDRGEIMGLVGESGCGKSVTSLSIMRLVPPPGRIEAGKILFDGRDLLTLSGRRDARHPGRPRSP